MANQLIHQSSPYLRQHADNPINWLPWSKKSLKKAEISKKPIFVSIGYSSCHWCHVMEEESFTNQKVADLLNRYFISIKVDKEERPDLDQYYQKVHRLLQRKPGGWPLCVFLTHKRKPFYTSTYIPLKPIPGISHGFLDILEIIAKRYNTDRVSIEKSANELENIASKIEVNSKAKNITWNIVDKFTKEIKSQYDSEYGGFGNAPKFPKVAILNAIITISKFDIDLKYMITHTLNMMSSGGMYDLVDGGFCRYSVDDKWLVPHFEKMAYDNGLLLEVYIRAFYFTKEKRYIEISNHIIEFLTTKMMKKNLFFSASDADSKDGEGEYFVYSYDEVKDSLIKNGIPKDNIKELLSSFNITEYGNFQTEHKEMKNIVRYEKSKEIRYYKKMIKILKEIRATREYPFVDNKIITSWNSMIIKSLFKISKNQAEFKKLAKNSMDTLVAIMYQNGILYHSTIIGKKLSIYGYLEDYAYIISALIEGYQATLQKRYLKLATDLALNAIEKFYTAKHWNFSINEFVVEAEIFDSSYPSSVGIMVDNLLILNSLSKVNFYKVAYNTIQYYSGAVTKYPSNYSKLFESYMRYLKGNIIIKSKASNLQEIVKYVEFFDYPFILLDTAIYNDFQVCSDRSCFLKVANKEELMQNIDKIIEDYKLLKDSKG